MRIAYFDCICGASGDMILGAMLDGGLSIDALRSGLSGLKLPDVELQADKVTKQGFACTQFNVRAPEQQPHRHLKDILRILDEGGLSDQVRERAERIFTRLADAEACVHGSSPDKIHFHEVGAVDAIVDVVGACIGLETLEVDQVVCSPIPVGSGTVQCQHGTMPVPAPATAKLLTGVPIADCDEPGELTTPTGAAILTTAAARFGPLPAMRIESIGYGAGRRDGRHRSNLHRLILGRAESPGEADEIVTLQANLDDATGQLIGAVIPRLLEAGALDAFTCPIGMKKGRPAILLTVLAEPHLADDLEAVLFEETPTFGVRRWNTRRRKLERAFGEASTPWGPVRIKLGLRGGRCISATPEYEDCLRLAREKSIALRRVIDQAGRACADWIEAPGSCHS